MEYAIGIDIGGTKIETDLISKRGKILKKSRVATPKQRVHILDAIETSVKSVRGNRRIEGIGIGCPGFIDRNNRLKLAPNTPSLIGIDLKKELRKRFSEKIIIENDANCFALAEYKYGAAVGSKHAVGIIWGTGIGAGLIIDGKLYRGHDGAAGEFAHFKIDDKGNEIESFCGAPFLVEHYRRMGGSVNVDVKTIVKEKDRISKKVMEQAIYHLSMGVACIVNMLNPEIIVIGGGISRSSHYRDINKTVKTMVSPALKGSFKIVKHKIGDDSGVIGAAALVFR